MNLYGDLVEIAKSVLSIYNMTTSDLKTDEEIIRRWVNVQLKVIQTTPRKVHKSKTLLRKKLASKLKEHLQAIESKFINGEDINPYLSTLIFKEDYTDNLFADWKIYHLHLNDKPYPKNPYFMDRSDYLLFIYIHSNNVYFIDVRPHKEKYGFAQKELLQIIHDEWPLVIKSGYSNSKIKLEININKPEEIDNLRKNNINIIHKLGDDIYISKGGGLTTSGKALFAITESDKLYFMTQKAESWITTEIDNIIQDLKNLYSFNNKPEFKLELGETNFIIKEINTNHIVKIVNP